MVYSPFEYFCKFMVEKKAGITKISKGPNFLKPLSPLGEIPSLRLCYMNMTWTLT